MGHEEAPSGLVPSGHLGYEIGSPRWNRVGNPVPFSLPGEQTPEPLGFLGGCRGLRGQRDVSRVWAGYTGRPDSY